MNLRRRNLTTNSSEGVNFREAPKRFSEIVLNGDIPCGTAHYHFYSKKKECAAGNAVS